MVIKSTCPSQAKDMTLVSVRLHQSGELLMRLYISTFIKLNAQDLKNILIQKCYKHKTLQFQGSYPNSIKYSKLHKTLLTQFIAQSPPWLLPHQPGP
jgi:hypothetical protein